MVSTGPIKSFHIYKHDHTTTQIMVNILSIPEDTTGIFIKEMLDDWFLSDL